MALSSFTRIERGVLLKQIGKKGISNHRWIVGGKLCMLGSVYIFLAVISKA